jgi:hypothetical protein
VAGNGRNRHVRFFREIRFSLLTARRDAPIYQGRRAHNGKAETAEMAIYNPSFIVDGVSGVRVEAVPGDNDRYLVFCYDADGREYWHTGEFSRPRADRLARKVAAVGRIDLQYWNARTPYGTQAWLIDEMEVTLMDDEERQAKGFGIYL